MSEEATTVLVQHVRRLEQQTARLRIGFLLSVAVLLVCLGLLVVLGAVVLAGPGVETVVAAQGFRLVDGEGRVRALLGTPAEAQGEVGLYLMTPEGLAQSYFTLNPQGSAELALLGKGERGLVELTARADGTPSLVVSPGAGSKARLTLTLSDKGEPLLGFRDDKDRQRAVLFLESGAPNLLLKNLAGDTIWRAP